MPEAAAGGGRWAVHCNSGGDHHLYQRDIARSSPTITSRAGRWTLRPAVPATWVQVTAGRTRPGDHTRPRDLGMPSHTVAFGHADMRWEQPGGESLRISVAEAGILQSFPVDYPWQGGRTGQYQQVGNAFPPLFAAHVLAAVTGLPAPL